MTEDGALFDVPARYRVAPKSDAPGKRWGGRASTNARKLVAAMLPAPCHRCGELITAEDPPASWHAGHIEDRAQGGADASSNYAPEHAACNMSAGGKLGAAMTNSRRAKPAVDRERVPQWW